MRNIIKALAALVLVLVASAFQVRRAPEQGRDPGSELAQNLRQSLQEEHRVNRDIEALFERLEDPAFATRLNDALLKQDEDGARMLVQSTARSIVDVEMGGRAGDRQCTLPPRGEAGRMVGGRFCWYNSNGIRKCLWYSDKC